MNLQWVYEADLVDWQALAHLYAIAPLGEKCPEELKTAFNNSRYCCFLYVTDKLIGAGRALADGVDCAYLCDVAVHPDFQGQGIGSAIIDRLLNQCRGHNKIILYAAPGKEAFYRRYGFKHMNTAMAVFANQERALKWGLVS